MPHTLIYSYDTLFDAESAQQQLMAAGIAADSIHLTVTQDEAGPMEGNFTVGNGRGESHDRPGVADNSPSGVQNHEVYERDFQPAAQHGTILLTVDLDAEDEEPRVTEILERYGGNNLQTLGQGPRAEPGRNLWP